MVMKMLNLATRLSNLPERRGAAPWPHHEYVKGWGVMALPFDSGHVLALRVFPENDFGPHKSLWRRDPEGHWSIHIDGPRLDTTCPRYSGAACAQTGFARLALTWTGPVTLQVTMDEPALTWTLTATTTMYLDVLNAVSAAMPTATWRPRALLRAREGMARMLGVGEIELSGVMPSGHTGTLMPKQMYFVDKSRAVLGGVDPGHPTHLAQCPTIGGVPLPARGMLAIAEAVWGILDPNEYAQTRAETSATSPSQHSQTSSH
jgi:hypothetical protein